MCKVFKSRNICPDAIAVAHSYDELRELIVKWEPNLSNLVQFLIPKADGGKLGQKRNLFSCAVEQHDVSLLQDPLEDVDAFAKREPYYLQWLQGSKVTTFYGCGKKFRSSMNDPSPLSLLTWYSVGRKSGCTLQKNQLACISSCLV